MRNNLNNAVTKNLDWSYAFEPSLAITTGRINKLGLNIRSFREPLKQAVKDVMVGSIRTNFDAQGRPVQWPELSDATWATRAAQGWNGGGILLKSGNLRRVASQQNIWTISETSATIRDIPQKAWYGKVHQGGYAGGGGGRSGALKFRKGKGGVKIYEKVGGGSTGRGATSIPQRQFLLIQKEDEEAIIDIFERWLTVKVAKAMAGRG
jgi:phage gpG-like protein